MKICKNCKQDKQQSEFYTATQRGNNDQIWKYKDSLCKACRSEYTTKRRKDIKIKCVEYLGGMCQDCGVVDTPEIYDFHHIDPNSKDFSIGQKCNYSFDHMKKELDKCVVLCANCHRKRHALENYKTSEIELGTRT